MRLQTGSSPTRRALIAIEYEHHPDSDHAVQATIDALADELHRRLWPLGINPTVTVEAG